jgi:hypothetical protein
MPVPRSTNAKRSAALLTALFFIALTALGLVTAGDYGQPWDEPWEQDILRMNSNQYLAALGSERRAWLRSDMDAPESGLIADSEEKDHGACAYYPLLGLVGSQTVSESARMLVWHLYTWLWFMAGAAALWLLCRRLGLSRVFSGLAVLFLMLSPRFFAQGHYNNKDIVLFSLVLLTLWLAVRLWEKPGFLRAMAFSLAGAAAANTKIIGLAVWGLCALFVLAYQLVKKRMTGRVWGVALVTLCSFAGLYALLTPALWPDPAGYLRYTLGNALSFSRWQNNVLFRGTVFHLRTESLPRYYLPYMMLVTTPLWIAVLAGVGQLFATGQAVKAVRTRGQGGAAFLPMLVTLTWLVPFLYAVLGRPVLYNGWRHFYFLYGPLLVLAAYGAHRLWVWLRARRSAWPRRIGAGALALCMAVTGARAALSHPNEYAFYNVLTSRMDVADELELDYWNVSVLPTLRALLTQLPGEHATIAGGELWSQTGLAAAYALLSAPEQARLTVLDAGDPSAEYVLVNRTYAVLGDWQEEAGREAVVTAESFGLPVCTVYARAEGGGA